MVPGADIAFSLDVAGLVPSGASLSSATVNVRSGSECVTIAAPTISGTKVLLRIVAVKTGLATFDVIAAFSDSTDDGDQVQVRVL
jgi:hypothetical protein